MIDRPLKILLTDPHLKGGGQVRYVASLARELAGRGHRVWIGCKPGSVLVECARRAGCACHDRFPFRGGLRYGAWRRDLGEACRFLRDEQPDILHASGSQDHWTAGIANRWLGRPACVVRTRHNTYPVHNGLTNRVLNRRWTDYEIVVCETVRSSLAAQPVFDETRMCTIHNGVDPEEFAPDPEARRRVRAEFGYADKHVVCGMAARLTEAKGHEFLFRAAARLTESCPALRILLLGQGVLEEPLKQSVREHGLEDIVAFGGFRNDMCDVMQAFDIGVQPSIACEASSFSLMEQMATGKPIVTSDHGGSKEIVRDGVDGFVVAAGTVEPLEAGLRRLLDDASLRETMGRSARQRVLESFTVGVLGDRTLDAYEKALAHHAAARQA